MVAWIRVEVISMILKGSYWYKKISESASGMIDSELSTNIQKVDSSLVMSFLSLLQSRRPFG